MKERSNGRWYGNLLLDPSRMKVQKVEVGEDVQDGSAISAERLANWHSRRLCTRVEACARRWEVLINSPFAACEGSVPPSQHMYGFVRLDNTDSTLLNLYAVKRELLDIPACRSSGDCGRRSGECCVVARYRGNNPVLSCSWREFLGVGRNEVSNWTE